MATALPPITARIDFADPQDAAAPRLRHAFGQPRQVLVAQQAAQLRPLLDALEAAVAQGAWAVGYLCYEAAAAFDPALTVHAVDTLDSADGPLAWFALYDQALPWPDSAAEGADVRVDWRASCERPAFDAAFAQIQQAIAAGALYQVNFTAPLLGTWSQPGAAAVDAAALFAALQRAQPGGYAALIDTGAQQLMSVSPELFFDWHGGQLLTRPMKGTAARGATPQADAAQAAALRASAKERAENVMVVDLLRNDLSRIAEPFSVRVEQLFQTQALPSVWQMTSDVRARSRAGVRLADVFQALFPCGSVTGAPKASAMQLIHQLEPGPRGVYCGAIGLVQPARDGGIRATFNVPIRTVSSRADGLRCGIGSGITADASAAGEWQEWRNKRAFVERASSPFELLETLALVQGALRNAPLHLQRMGRAAAHFGYPWSLTEAREKLQQLVCDRPLGRWRVRLLCPRQGPLQVQAFALEDPPSQVCLQLATRPIEDTQSEFVRFKTTRRSHYDAFAPQTPGVFDTVLWNTEGEITECTRGNLLLRLDGRWLTPALACGLLPGVARAQALRSGQVAEAVLRLEDLARVDGWVFLNSLRGQLPAQLLP